MLALLLALSARAETYTFTSVQRYDYKEHDMIALRGALSCERGDGTMNCTVVGGELSLEFLTNEGVVLKSVRPTYNAPIRSTWAGGALLEVVDYEDVPHAGMLRLAIGAMQLPTLPAQCSPGERWKVKEPLGMMRIPGVDGASSYRTIFTTEGCQGSVATVSIAATSTMTPVWIDVDRNRGRFTFKGRGLAVVDTASGVVQRNEYHQAFVSGNTATTVNLPDGISVVVEVVPQAPE